MNLLILPCTPHLGDYGRSMSWKLCKRVLKEHLEDFKFCAVDCSQVFNPHPDPKGLLVLEEDVATRNKGIDVWPGNLNRSGARPEEDSPFRWSGTGNRPPFYHYHLLADAAGDAISQLAPDYKKIFVLLSPRYYRIAIAVGIRETIGFEHVYLDNQPSGAFANGQGMARIVLQLEHGILLPGIWDFPKYGAYYPKFEENIRKWRKDPLLPERFAFFRWEEFHPDNTDPLFQALVLQEGGKSCTSK